jgi:phosphoribosylformimino-5-aminoimidazole carboxamide ribotide isomerase
MIVYPAMDLMDGRVVRLRQGRFEESTIYSGDPAAAMCAFSKEGAEWGHVVDLDGARAGIPVQHDLVAELANAVPLKLQVAGGFRERDQLARMFKAGVARVVIGSLAVKQPEAVQAFLDEFGPDRITLSLDVRIVEDTPMVAINGWTEDSRRSLWEIAALYPQARHLLLTDIGRDGMLQGPNFALYAEAARRLPHMCIQASGGIASLADLESLSTDGAIIGKALWEGRIQLQEALGLARS